MLGKSSMMVVVVEDCCSSFRFLLHYNMLMDILEHTSTKLDMESMNSQCMVCMVGMLLPQLLLLLEV
jgi:hypothetical protein